MVKNGGIQGAKWGSGQERGGRRQSAVNRAEFSSCGEVISCRSCEQPWWRTELDLSSGKSFDDLHRSATVGTEPKRVGILGRGFRFDLHWNGAQCCEAQRR